MSRSASASPSGGENVRRVIAAPVSRGARDATLSAATAVANIASAAERQQTDLPGLLNWTRSSHRRRLLVLGDPLQLQHQIARGLPAVSGILGQAARDHTVQTPAASAASPRTAEEDRVWRIAPITVAVVDPLEGSTPARHLVEHRAKREEIAARIGFAPGQLFGRHVLKRAEERALSAVSGSSGEIVAQRDEREPAQFREAEVEQLRALLGQHHVARLEIAVDDALPMRVIEGAGELDRIAQNVVNRQWTSDQAVGERLALEVLHDQERDRRRVRARRLGVGASPTSCRSQMFG